MKRRQRKPVLDINGESADSLRRRWPGEHYGQQQNVSNVANVSNPLTNLIGNYQSDDEVDINSRPKSQLNDQVNDFLKEIQSIAPEDKSNKNSSSHPGSYWQECYDKQTGFPYYWHTETNQVTWEIPPELKVFLEKNKKDEPSSQSLQSSPWTNLSPSNYGQTQNIPEGMIPKEVVARNRNRQAGISKKTEKPPGKPNNCKSVEYKHDMYEDEKIEMITSFGNNESESEESEHDEPKKIIPSIKKPLPKNSKGTTHLLKKNPSSDNPIAQIGPVLPPVFPLHFGPKNQEKLSEKLSQDVQKKSSFKTMSNNSEEDILMRLKNQAKLLQSKSHNDPLDGENKQKYGKSIKLSLVPGYEDDSDGEDETPIHQPVQPLFPITESSTMVENNTIARKIETNSGNIRIYEYKNSDTVDESFKQTEEIIENKSSEESQEESKTDQESKANKFLENIGESSKRFQRKPRIAFDVVPNKTKPESSDEAVATRIPSPATEKEEISLAKIEDHKDEVSETSDATFVETNEDNKVTSDDNNKNNGNLKEDNYIKEDKPKEIKENEKAELRGLTEPIMEKLKFLSEGSPAASAVQVMAIQIQTLLSAWESGVLQETYLRNWLDGTGCELTRLEQTAAPLGWECQWDRTHKRYYYRNKSTNEAQWTYPQTDIAGGTEEMELCTTPPPPEHEDSPIIEMSTHAKSSTVTTATALNSLTTSTTLKEVAEASISPGINSEILIDPPPPPNISSPSPPPPPRINADDLKRGQKRKEHPDNILEKKDDSSKDRQKLEPIPPGVEPPPESAYSLPVAALEAAGVLYGAQQTNPIYAATLAGAGIPLISHHPHLMQGQLMHYTPATYHPHLHNQALVAARLQGQEAVQFMVAEYTRMYENNQVITKPPVKMSNEVSDIGTALNSFYSDIATIEKNKSDVEKERMTEIRPPEVSAASPVPQAPIPDSDTADCTKEKKKKKLKTGIGKKQKEMSSMVAKWQMAQKVYKEGH